MKPEKELQDYVCLTMKDSIDKVLQVYMINFFEEQKHLPENKIKNLIKEVNNDTEK